MEVEFITQERGEIIISGLESTRAKKMVNKIEYCLLLQMFLEPKIIGQAKGDIDNRKVMGQIMTEQRETVELEVEASKKNRERCIM